MVDVVIAQPDAALEFWHEIDDHVRAALDHDYFNTCTIEDIKRQVKEGFAIVVLCAEGGRVLSATVAQMYVNAKEERLLHVMATAGTDRWAWLADLDKALEQIAADNGCVAVTLAGRKGWTKTLNPLGWKTEHVTMRKEVNAHGRSEQGTAA